MKATFAYPRLLPLTEFPEAVAVRDLLAIRATVAVVVAVHRYECGLSPAGAGMRAYLDLGRIRAGSRDPDLVNQVAPQGGYSALPNGQQSERTR